MISIDRKIDVTAVLFLLVQNKHQTHDWTLIGLGAYGLGKQECFSNPPVQREVYCNPQSEERFTVTPQSEERFTVNPQSKERFTVPPQSKERSTVTPQSKERFTVTPQSKERSTVTPQSKERSNVTPQSEERSTVIPQSEERSTVIPQSEERSTVTSESESEERYVRTLKTIYVIPSNGKVNSVLIPIHRLSSSTGRWQCLQVWTWTKSCNRTRSWSNRTRSWSNRTRPLPHFYCPSKYQLNPVFGCSENKKCSIFPVNAYEKVGNYY